VGVAEVDTTEEPVHYLVQHIREALAHDPQVSELEIDVKIRGKKVFLKGTVPTTGRQEAITAVAQAVAPDHDIHNETIVATLSEEPGVERLS
jgi:osmotically-inducible protein OsmY